MITPALQNEIEQQIRRKILSIVPLSAANNAQIYRLNLDDRNTCVAKVAERGLDTEAFMLKYLKDNSPLPVPRVYYSNPHVIIMEYINARDSRSEASDRHAAELLAQLHGITQDNYGFAQDTTIGSMRQPNTPTKDWHAFFAQHRLLHMGGEALREGKIDAKMMKQIEKICSKLPQLLGAPQAPSLVHGDVWGGNVLFTRGKVAAFLDPAIYFADAEVELAFVRLFSTFGEGFFARYNELRPLRSGFETRADIYNIYPLLAHCRLFGPSYARKAQRIIEKYV